jgi:hypothetical protein
MKKKSNWIVGLLCFCLALDIALNRDSYGY